MVEKTVILTIQTNIKTPTINYIFFRPAFLAGFLFGRLYSLRAVAVTISYQAVACNLLQRAPTMPFALTQIS